MGHNSPEYIRVVAEAMKRATIDKEAHVGDPAFVEVPLDRLIDKEYAKELADRIRGGEKAHVVRMGGSGESAKTIHISAIEAEGNAVTMTDSLGAPSGLITDLLGFMHNG